jgi:hypothetical protein
MLDIALQKLTGGTEEQVVTHEVWLGVDEGHDILQLVAKTDGSSGLVETAAPPKTANQSLV